MIEITIYEHGMSDEEKHLLDVLDNWDPSKGNKAVMMFGRHYWPTEIVTIKSPGANRKVIRLSSSGKVK